MGQNDTIPIQFDLEDALGKKHVYEGYFHPADEGLELSFMLIQMLGEPLLRAVGDLKDTAQTAIETAAGTEEIGAMLVGIDFAAALGALREIEPKTVVGLSKRIFGHTTRDGDRLKEHVYNKAYRGNYEELYIAMWKVVEANNFIPLLSTLSEDEGLPAE